MTIASMLRKPMVLRYVTATVADEYGQPVETTSEVDSTGYYRLVNASDSDSVSREQTDLKVYLPADIDTDGLSSVVIDDTEYQVDGPPHRQYNPRVSGDAYILVPVRRAA